MKRGLRSKNDHVFKPMYDDINYSPKIEAIEQLKEEVAKCATLKIDLDAMISAFKEHARSNTTPKVPIKQYKQRSTKATEGVLNQVISQSMWIPDHVLRNYLSVTITVYPSGAVAADNLEARAQLLTPPEGIVNVKKELTKAANDGTTIRVWGVTMVNLRVYKNVRVEIGNIDYGSPANTLCALMIDEFIKLKTEN